MSNSFVIGDIVILIDNKAFNGEDTCTIVDLTIGNHYVILDISKSDVDPGIIHIKNDLGKYYGYSAEPKSAQADYFAHRFIGLRESRRMKLERLFSVAEL